MVAVHGHEPAGQSTQASSRKSQGRGIPVDAQHATLGADAQLEIPEAAVAYFLEGNVLVKYYTTAPNGTAWEDRTFALEDALRQLRQFEQQIDLQRQQITQDMRDVEVTRTTFAFDRETVRPLLDQLDAQAVSDAQALLGTTAQPGQSVGSAEDGVAGRGRATR